MVTLNFAFLQPEAYLGANIVVTLLGKKKIGLLEDFFAPGHISSSDLMLMVNNDQR